MKKQPSYLSFATLTFLLFCLPAHGLEVLTAGDSITQGLFRTLGGSQSGVTSPQNGSANFGGFQPRLNQRLDAEVEASTVYNYGVAGANSRDGLTRINTILDSRPADYILINYGANDLYQGISDSANQSFMRLMMIESLEKDVTPIIAEITPNTNREFRSDLDGFIKNFYNVRIRGLIDDFAEASEPRELAIANHYQKLRPGWTSVPHHSGDGLHMGGSGNTVMADEWLAAIKRQIDFDRTISISPILPLLLD
ncbi:MAG: SGNH/GDSL hydrolase family protein [Acidiferrobacterales bacterium]|nr:SGNH/GDSL hydrolase family protein [Acidiferrobacterales bacterium]